VRASARTAANVAIEANTANPASEANLANLVNQTWVVSRTNKSRDDRQPQFKMKSSSAAVLITLGCGAMTLQHEIFSS
jgi:hypothetical protein